MKFLSLIAAVAGLATSALAQTPPGYTWAQSNKTLFLKYSGFPVFKGGAVLPYAEPTYQPAIYSSLSHLNGTYIVFFVDADANKSAAVPAKLLWLVSGVTFSNYTNYDPGAVDVPLYPAISGNSSRVPYVTPSIPGHTYIAFIYQSPPNFEFPPNFPYNATVRDGFNVTRIGVDFKAPLLEANYFTILSNATTTATATATATWYGGTATGYPGYRAQPTEYAPTASPVPFLGSANALKWPWTSRTLLAAVVAMIVL